MSFDPTWFMKRSYTVCLSNMMHLNVIAFIFLRINQTNNDALFAQLIQEVKVKRCPVCLFW